MLDASETTDPIVDDLEEAYRLALAANEAAESIIGPDESAETAADVVSETSAETDRTVLSLNDTADRAEDASENRRAAQVPEPKRVIEAALFVGGSSLTTKKLCALFRGDVSHEYVSDAIDELNREYETESRPYVIHFGEGGYRLALRPDFERVRNRVYGQGPREIRLSQESLEVLALVAYFQPITKEQVEKRGKQNAGPLLRQLLRRELIALERDKTQPKRVQYCTTPRFLSLFGLGHIDELPRADDLNFK